MKTYTNTNTDKKSHTGTYTQADTLGMAVPTLPKRTPFPEHTNIKQQYK